MNTTRGKFTIVLLIIAVFILGNLSNSYLNIQSFITSKTRSLLISSSKPIQNIQPVVGNKTTQTAPETNIKKIGDSFGLWGMEYQVVSATNFSPAYDFQKTSGKYVGVIIKVTNNGKTESSVNRIYIKDSKGRQYDSTVLGYQQLNVKDYGEKVQAGLSETFGVVFEIAKDSTGLELIYPSAQGTIGATVKLGL